MRKLPQILTHVTNKMYVDNSIDNATLLKLDPNEKLDITNQVYITLNSAFTSKETIINIPISDQHLVRNNQVNDFNGYKLTNISSVNVNHDAVEEIDLVTLGYEKSLHEANERNRRRVGIDFYDESSDSVINNIKNNFKDNTILNVRSIEINDEPLNDSHFVNKKYIKDEFLTKQIHL